MTLTTPLIAGTKLGSTPVATEHAQWVQLGYDNGGAWVPAPLDANGLDVDVTRSRSHGAFYTAAQGGRMAFNSVTGFLTIPSGSVENNLAAFQNPSGSGVDVVMSHVEFAASVNTRFRRYRGASTISVTGAARASGNQGGGSAVAAAKLYAAGTYTATGANETATPANAANLRKAAYITAFTQYVVEIDGRSILRPGQQHIWTMDNDGNASFTALVYVEWHEVAAAA